MTGQYVEIEGQRARILASHLGSQDERVIDDLLIEPGSSHFWRLHFPEARFHVRTKAQAMADAEMERAAGQLLLTTARALQETIRDGLRPVSRERLLNELAAALAPFDKTRLEEEHPAGGQAPPVYTSSKFDKYGLLPDRLRYLAAKLRKQTSTDVPSLSRGEELGLILAAIDAMEEAAAAVQISEGADVAAEAAYVRMHKMEDAVRWALGEDEEEVFDPGANTDRYWWRSRLRAKAFGDQPTNANFTAVILRAIPDWLQSEQIGLLHARRRNPRHFGGSDPYYINEPMDAEEREQAEKIAYTVLTLAIAMRDGRKP